jgi:aldose 1-epimerase
MLERFLILAMAATIVLAANGADDSVKPTVVKKQYGKAADGASVDEFTIFAGPYTVKLLTYGAAVSELLVPDRMGKTTDVVLGFEDMAGWQSKGNPYFGCIVGRVANRIAKARFALGGKEFKLADNNPPNALHGGVKGFDKVIWQGEQVERPEGASVRFTYLSRDGEEGYPGNLKTQVMYSLSHTGALTIEYEATADQPTPVNLTNHCYFNLNGALSGTTVLNHELAIRAKKYTPADATLIPTGEIAAVAGTPLDFTAATPIGARIQQIQAKPVGYDHNYVLDAGGGQLSPAARASSPTTGIALEMQTTEPGLQLYSGNFLDGSVKGKGGVAYPQYGGFCLEAQHFPDSVNQPKFPSVILQPAKVYRQTTVYRFLAK